MIWSCCSGSLWTGRLWWEAWTTRTLNWPLEKAARLDSRIHGPGIVEVKKIINLNFSGGSKGVNCATKQVLISFVGWW